MWKYKSEQIFYVYTCTGGTHEHKVNMEDKWTDDKSYLFLRSISAVTVQEIRAFQQEPIKKFITYAFLDYIHTNIFVH